MRIKLAALMVAVAIGSASAQTNEPEIDINPIIDLFADQLPDIRDTVSKYDEAPEAGWLTYWDKDKYQTDLNKALDKAFETLVPNVYQQTRQRLLEFDKAVDQGKEERSELIISRDMARPGGDPSLMDRAMLREVPKGSKEDFERKIEALDKEIEAIFDQRAALIENFKHKLSDEYGVELDTKQVEAALYQLNGTAIVEAVVVGKVLIEVEKRLGDILSKDISQSVTRKYYGIAAINRLVIARMHEKHLQSYTVDWLPKLDKVEEQNKAETAAIKQTLRAAKSDANKKAAQANLNVREQIADVITRYRQILVSRQKVTERAYALAREDAEVALQTLKTLETASQLGILYGDSTAEFNALMQVKAPDLLPLDDASVLEQFIDMSREMHGS